MKHVLFCIAAASMICLAAGCKSEAFYHDLAVKKARTYAIEHLPELSEEARHEVSYTKPVIMKKRLFGRGEGAESKRDIVQSCIVWKLPEDGTKRIVVFGVGQNRMDDWYPVRALIKTYEVAGKKGAAAPEPEKEKKKHEKKDKNEQEKDE